MILTDFQINFQVEGHCYPESPPKKPELIHLFWVFKKTEYFSLILPIEKKRYVSRFFPHYKTWDLWSELTEQSRPISTATYQVSRKLPSATPSPVRKGKSLRSSPEVNRFSSFLEAVRIATGKLPFFSKLLRKFRSNDWMESTAIASSLSIYRKFRMIYRTCFPT